MFGLSCQCAQTGGGVDRVEWGWAITWDDGVNADRGVASQREAKVLLPPVHANDPEKQEVAKIRIRMY